jgi:hypothetical protein
MSLHRADTRERDVPLPRGPRVATVAIMITDTTPAERIFRGGTILTMDDARPRAQAIAIGSGRILAVGDDADVMVTRMGTP